MANPSRDFILNLQHEARFGPNGLFLQGALDELVLAIPKVIRPGWGEKLVTASAGAGITVSSFAAFVDENDDPPLATAPSNTAVTWELGHIEASASLKVSFQRASKMPNDQMAELVRFYRMTVARLFASSLASGAGIASKQWLGFDNAAFPNKTSVLAGAATKEGVLATLKVMDDTVATHEHGRRASCFVTTARGRRNIEAAQEQSGIDVRYGRVQGVFNEVPFYRGRPVLISSGLEDGANTSPVFAMDFTQVFFFATSGDPRAGTIDNVVVPPNASGNQGVHVYISGALVSGSPVAITESDITHSLSA